MKFGKQLLCVIDNSDPEWAAFWVSYKALKKTLKEVPRASCPPSDGAGGTDTELQTLAAVAVSVPDVRGADQTTRAKKGEDPRAGSKQATKKALSSSPEEASFFRLVHREVRKAHDFFVSAEAQFAIRLAHVRAGMKMVDMDTVLAKNEDSWRQMMAACVQLYKDLLRLENYAIVTWTSFSKILKKHDKWTGYCTRNEFMKNVIHKQPFTQYPKLSRMLEEVEAMYNRIQRIRECSQFRNLNLADEQLFLDTIRGINRDCVKLQEEEGGERFSKRQRQAAEESGSEKGTRLTSVGAGSGSRASQVTAATPQGRKRPSPPWSASARAQAGASTSNGSSSSTQTSSGATVSRGSWSGYTSGGR